MVSIKPGYITTYTQCTGGRRNFSDRQRDNMANLKDNEHNGNISKKAAKRIRLAIEWLLYVTDEKTFFSEKHRRNFKFKINFVTLTLSSAQIHSDNEIKKELLNQFLIEARKKWKVEHYLWRAESQKNGNIHFHILMDKFVPWEDLRSTWNRIQNKLGYIDRYSTAMRKKHEGGFRFDTRYSNRWSYQQQHRAYKKAIKEDWHNPNSTDVHAINKIRNIAAYIAKYCTKNEDFSNQPGAETCPVLPFADQGVSTSDQNSPLYPRKLRKIEGKLWRLSQSLSKYKSAVDVIDSYLSTELNQLFHKFKDKVIYHDHFSVLCVPVYIWRKFISGDLLKSFNFYISEMAAI